MKRAAHAWLPAACPADPAVDDPPGQGFTDATGVFNNWSFRLRSP